MLLKLYKGSSKKRHCSTGLYCSHNLLLFVLIQIQFRLHQINAAAPEDRDQLLKELNEFAHKGCVDQNDLQCPEEDVRCFT